MTDREAKLAKNREYVRKARANRSLEAKRRDAERYCLTWKDWACRRVGGARHEDKLKKRQCNITTAYITGLLESAGRKCAMTGIELTHDKSLWSMSIDRIDNRLGHVIGNVQLVCMGINLAKNRHTNDDARLFVDCLRGISKFEPARISRDYLSNCRRNATERDRGRGLVCDTDTDFIVKLLEDCDYRCPFTGIKMACYQHPVFSASLDRIDNTLGHLRSNVRVVAKAVNVARGVRPDVELVRWLDAIKGVGAIVGQ